MSEQRDYALGVRNVKVFTTQSETMGLPTMVFSVGIALSVGIFAAFFQNSFMTALITAFFTSVIYYPFMYLMHREDPNGFEVWRSSMSEKTYWLAGSAEERSLEIIPKHRS